MTTSEEVRKQLCEAAKRGDEGKVALLLERGCDANAAEPATRETAGHVAARFGRLAALFELFARGADPHARNARGRTPLHDASRTSNPACARLVAAAAANRLPLSLAGWLDCATGALFGSPVAPAAPTTRNETPIFSSPEAAAAGLPSDVLRTASAQTVDSKAEAAASLEVPTTASAKTGDSKAGRTAPHLTTEAAGLPSDVLTTASAKTLASRDEAAPDARCLEVLTTASAKTADSKAEAAGSLVVLTTSANAPLLPTDAAGPPEVPTTTSVKTADSRDEPAGSLAVLTTSTNAPDLTTEAAGPLAMLTLDSKTGAAGSLDVLATTSAKTADPKAEAAGSLAVLTTGTNAPDLTTEAAGPLAMSAATSVKTLDSKTGAAGSLDVLATTSAKTADPKAEAAGSPWCAGGGSARLRLLLGAADSDGWSALHFAVRANCIDTVGILLSLGACPNAADRALKTPLHLAAAKCHAPSIRLLLSAGAHAAAVDAAGNTALHCASVSGVLEAVQLLAPHGGCAATNKRGASPHALALEHGNTAVASYLAQLQS